MFTCGYLIALFFIWSANSSAQCEYPPDFSLRCGRSHEIFFADGFGYEGGVVGNEACFDVRRYFVEISWDPDSDKMHLYLNEIEHETTSSPGRLQLEP